MTAIDQIDDLAQEEAAKRLGLDHDAFSSNRAEGMNVIASNKMEHDVTQRPVPTLWHHALTRSRLNDLLRGKLAKFSLDALVNIAASAHLSIEIRVRGAA